MSQYKKQTVETRILNSAKKMFLRQGYLKSSLRAICSDAEITLSNLYNYYSDKDALFVAVLKNELEDIEQLCEYGRKYQSQNGSFETLQDKQKNIHIAFDYIDKHRQELNLLFNLSAGSSLENYPNYLAEEYEKNWDLFFNNLHKESPHKTFKKPSSFFLQTMASFQIMAACKIIAHDLTRDEMTQLSEELATFFWYGGMRLMNSE